MNLLRRFRREPRLSAEQAVVLGHLMPPAVPDAVAVSEVSRMANVIISAKLTVDELLTQVRQEQSWGPGAVIDELLDLRGILSKGVPDA